MLKEFVKKYGYQLVNDEYELEAGKGYHLWFSDENNKLHIFKNNTLIAVFTDSEDRKEGLHVLGTMNDLNELEKLYTNIYSLLNYIYNEYENKVMYEYGRMQVEKENK